MVQPDHTTFFLGLSVVVESAEEVGGEGSREDMGEEASWRQSGFARSVIVLLRGDSRGGVGGRGVAVWSESAVKGSSALDWTITTVDREAGRMRRRRGGLR